MSHDTPLADEIDTLGLARRKNGSPERTVQVTLVKYLRQVMPGVRYAAVKNEHAPKSATKAGRMRFFAKRKAEGVMTGHPDLIVYPVDQPIFLIETKAPKNGVVSADQADVHVDLRARGVVVIVANSIETLRYGMQQAGICTIEAVGQLVTAPKIRVAKRKFALPVDAVPF